MSQTDIVETGRIEVHIRWMIRKDLPEVLAIDMESYDLIWLEEDFTKLLRETQVIGMVAEYREVILGYMVYRLHKLRPRYRRARARADRRPAGLPSGIRRRAAGAGRSVVSGAPPTAASAAAGLPAGIAAGEVD